MIDTKQLRQKILDLAIRGKLVPQDPNEEPAAVLLERIKAEKERLIAEGKIKRSKKSAKASDTPHYENVPFEIPESWEWQTLGDIGKWQAGGTPSRGHKEYYGGNIPWLKTGDLNDGYITEIPEHITQDGLRNSSAKLNPKDSVLIALYGATIGKTGILTFPASTNQACCACTEYPAVDKLFLFFFLNQHRNIFISQGGGGAQPNISKEIIVATLIPIPPLAEQKRIVVEIQRWFCLIDEIESNKTKIENYVKQTKSKILDLAINGKLVSQDPNDEPSIELLKRINPDFVPCDTSHYENTPNGWTLCAVNEYVEKVTDFVASGSFATIKNNVKYYKEPNYALMVKTKDFQNDFSEDLTYTDKQGYDFLSNSNLFGGELILSNVGSIGKVFIVPHFNRKMTLAPNAIMIRFHNDTDIEWFYYFFLSDYGKNKLRSISSATAISKFNKTDFKKIIVPIPPQNEMKRVVEQIKRVFYIIDSISAEL